MSLSTTQYGYIIDPLVPLTDDTGRTISNGYVRVFVAGTSTPVITYANFDGTANQERIELDNSGRTMTKVIASKGNLYKVCVYDAEHSQEDPVLTVDKVAVIGASINANGATIVTGLDSVTVHEENFIKATVERTSVELSLDPTEVTSEVSTISAAETAAPDVVVPLLDKTGKCDSKKISLANLFKFSLDWISRLATTITSFASDDFIAVSNPTDGTRKMAKNDLLNISAKNVLSEWGVGFPRISLNGSDIENNGKYIVAPSGALSNNLNYRTSNKISVYEGQKITLQARSPSLGAASMAVYAADGTLRNIYVVSAINVTEIFSHDCVASDSYVMFSCHNSYTSYLQATISSTGIQKDVEKLNSDVIVINSSLSALSTDVAKNSSDIEKVYLVGEFYKNAWVRYSDGRVNPSTGGAKTYIIYRDQLPKKASKIIARVCTESTTFCAIAFYSSRTPSTSTYMQSSSVQGITSTQTSTFQATIPQSWESAVVMNMSQHQATYSIELDVPNATGIDEVVSIAKNYSAEAKSLVNVFSKKPLYHHLDPDAPAANQSIPSQSLFDVAYASALGFDFIEANLHKCSDDVFVCKHGVSGKLGRGLKSVNGTLTPEEVADISFADVTSEWLRENVVYDCVDASFNSFIPTFDEFCSECKKYGLGIKFEGMDALSIARKYFPDDRLFINSDVRGKFKGTVEIVWKPSTETIDAAIGRALVVGSPCQIVIAAGSDIYNIDLKSVCQKVHSNGLLIGIVYPKTNDVLYALKNGVDAICTTYRAINTFDNGDLLNIGRLDDSRLVLTSATYDSETKTIQMSSGGTIVLNFESAEAFAKVCARLRYSGNLTISCGVNSDYYNLEECESDGSSFVEVALAIAPTSSNQSFTRAITITANESTVVYGLKINVGRTI